ncbi:MAG: FIST N-terminal domain-containing protein [Candidatus Thiodiazotropha sp.]|jgi:hypothetical protein
MLKDIIFNETNSLIELVSALSQLEQKEDIASILLFACDENNYPVDATNSALQNLSTPIIGGVFPQVLYADKAYSKGFVLVGLSETLTVRVIPELSSEQTDYEALISQTFAGLDDARSLFVFVDGLAKRIGSLIDGLYVNFGTQPKYIGGGAGSLSFTQKPCLFTNQGMLMDAAVIGLTSMHTALGVGHGWKTIVPDLQVTKSDRNIVQEINYKPAFEVYQQLVNEHSLAPINTDNFFDISKSFPLGIHKLGKEKIVRDPIAVTSEGYLICVGEIPRDYFIDLLTAKPNDLIEAAQQVAHNSKLAAQGRGYELTIFLDCISRTLFLKDSFNDEVAAVRSVIGASIPLVGALVLGEIANLGSDYLEFHNKTSVVGLI